MLNRTVNSLYDDQIKSLVCRAEDAFKGVARFPIPCLYCSLSRLCRRLPQRPGIVALVLEPYAIDVG